MIRATQDGFAYERAAPGLLVRRIVKAGQFVPESWFADAEGTTPISGSELTDQELAVINKPPANMKWQVDTTGESWVDVSGRGPTSVTPDSLPLGTAPPFDLTFAGSFAADGAYEVSIVSSTGQWTFTPSKDGEGEVLATDTALVATFAVAPDADEPGVGYVQVKDLATDAIIGGQLPFTWEAGAKETAKAKAEPEETEEAKEKPVTKARRRAPDE